MHKYFISVACTLLLCALWIEFENQAGTPYLPAMVCLIAGYSMYSACRHNSRMQNTRFSVRSLIGLIYTAFCITLTCTPIDDLFHRYWFKTPYTSYRWLSVSLLGVTCATAFYISCTVNGKSRLNDFVAHWTNKIWRTQHRLLVLCCTIWVFTATNLISYFVFEHIPHVQDSIAQLFQAKIFASGHLTAPPPPIPVFFQYFYDNLIITKDQWYSQYPPAHPFFLMIGVLLGAPWIINPLFASFSVMLLYGITRQYYSSREARLATLLLSVSPFFLFMSASYMNHVPTLFFSLLFLFTLNKSRGENKPFYGLLCGLSLGILLNIRMGEAVMMGAVFGSIYLISVIRRRQDASLAAFSAAFIVLTGVLLVYNYATNGNPFLFGYQLRWGANHTLGFAASTVITTPPHTPLRGLGHTLSNFIALNQNLFEWPVPSLLFIIVFFMPYFFRKNPCDYWLLAGLFGSPIFYFFYFYQDICLGPRFFYNSLPFAVMLTARSMVKIIDKIRTAKSSIYVQRSQALVSLLVFSVLFAGAVRMPRLIAFYSDSFWEVDNRLMKKAQSLGITNAVIFQKSYGLKGNTLGSGFLHNEPGLNSSIVFARDLGSRNAKLIRFFPGRKYYLALRDSEGKVIIEPLVFNGS
jgi:4-amino-4-deoxy-L-arabinose transferase-like glycosyltransferase